MRRRLLAALGALTVLLPSLATTPRAAGASVAVLVIDGKGFGHGVGMAQDGAYWMGKAGSTTPQILGHFYPGTKPGKAGGNVRVNVHSPSDGQVVVNFPNGGELRDAIDGGQSPGFPVRVGAGGQVRVRFDGTTYSVEGGAASASSSSSQAAETEAPTPSSPTEPSSASAQQVEVSTTTSTSTTTTTTAPPPSSTTTTTTAPPPPPKKAGPASSRPLWAVPSGGGTTLLPVRNRRYRGVVELTAQRGPFRAVNQVDVEVYLKGMGEVRDPKWPAAGLRAQAVAARTYAMRAMRANNEICDDQRCQVYLGSTAEYAAMNKAVDETRGQVLLFGSALASTVYSANGGAHSASRQEGFGTPDDNAHPYLRPAPYTTQDPFPWQVSVALTDVAGRLGYKGALTSVSIARKGPSGRAVEVVLDGAAGPKTVTGIGFARAFSLRSTLFSLSTGTAEAAPPPPPEGEGEGLQAPPEAAVPFSDPNALPPDPFSADELAAAVPPLDQFAAAPEPEDVAAPPVPDRSSSLPWAGLAGFCLLAVGSAAGGLFLARRR